MWRIADEREDEGFSRLVHNRLNITREAEYSPLTLWRWHEYCRFGYTLSG